MSDKGIIVPPVLYLPINRDASGEVSQTPIAKLVDGRKAIFAFTALDRLSDNCGQDQEWILIPTDSLGLLQAELDFEVVSVDKPVPESRTRVSAASRAGSRPVQGVHGGAVAGSREVNPR